MKKFPFEDISLILHRNCNLKCSYCPLNHFQEKMDIEILKGFMNGLLQYSDHKIYLCLFGGEPLLNFEAIKFLESFFQENKQLLEEQQLFFEVKIITNGTLISDAYVEIFENFHTHPHIDFEINLSIDGTKETQLSQRGMRYKQIDYYDSLSNNILKLKAKKLPFTFGLVMSFYKTDFIEDIEYLWNTYQIPIFIMPVDLGIDFIRGNKYIYDDIKTYLLSIKKTIDYFKKPDKEHIVLNLQEKGFMDIKMPPIGPTLSHDGEIYVTRDYLFTMDGSSGFDPIYKYPQDSISDIIEYFTQDNISELERTGLKTYYGKTIVINKKIGDYFTKLIYS